MENQNTNIKEFTFLGRSMESVSIIYGIFLKYLGSSGTETILAPDPTCE